MSFCLSKIFRCLIPESTDDVVIIRPIGRTYITGMASQYDEEYDSERLSKFIREPEYRYMME